jgi:hypothetical protein
MKKFLPFLLTIFVISAKAQFIPVLITYDNVEVYTWFGAWANLANSGYYTNASVSPTASAATYGIGSSTSAVEQNRYVLPNVTGLDATRSHLFKFRLGSYRFTSINSTRGVDVADYVEVSISVNGGVTYTSEVRITGFSNAFWNYNTGATISKTANGVNSIYSPSAGGDRTSTGDGYSVVELTIPAGTTQLAVDIFCRTNSAGEEWWLDNMELYVLEPDAILPVDLISFSGDMTSEGVRLDWQTHQEVNNSHFIVERSADGIWWDSILHVQAKGEVSGSLYSEVDKKPFAGINYYRLKQYDTDGAWSVSNIISVQYKFNQVEAYTYQKDGLLEQALSFETSEISSGLYYLNLIGDGPVSSIIKVRILN